MDDTYPAPVTAAEVESAQRLVIVRIAGDDPDNSLREIVEAAAGDVARFAEGWRVQVVQGIGGELESRPSGAELEILASLLPASEEVRALVAGLPVDLSTAAPVLGGTRYPAAEVGLAVALSTGERSEDGDTSPPRWLVVGREPRAVGVLVAERIFRTVGFGADGWEEGTDYMLRGSARERRAGGWRRDGGDVRAEDQRDDFAEVAEWFAGLRRVPAGPVTLLVDGGVDSGSGHSEEASSSSTMGRATTPASAYDARLDPERLAGELREAVAEMTRLLGGDGATIQSLTVAIERDHVEQIRHTGKVGEAVAGGAANLHLVLHPDDGFAYRHGLALALLDRSWVSASGPLPPYLRHGAALWLVDPGLSDPRLSDPPLAAGAAPSGPSWYGLPWRGWLPHFAAADVLPTADELLAEEDLADGSFLIWAPVAARIVDALPGSTLAERLGDRAALRRVAEEVLAELARGAEGKPVTATSRAFPSRDSLPPFLAGVSLAMLNDLQLGYQSPSVDLALGHLRAALGANAVSLMPFAYQPAPGEPAMRYLNSRPGSETDIAMIHAGRRADERGFTVLWKPQIWLRGSWPGEVEMGSPADWRAWFRAYRRFVVHQAVLARWVGAEVFSVGVELGRTVEREADWRRVIAAVRQIYDGPLTYSANWYGDFDRVPFWDEMDFLGIDAYEPLTDDPDADEAALTAGAQRVVAHLKEAARQHGKPLLLTEVGFAAHEAAWVAPHEEGGPLSHQDQARAYRALLEALGRPDWLHGVFVWKAFSNASASAPGGRTGSRRVVPVAGERADFRILHRPAEDVIRWYFEAPAPAASGQP